ncbi:MAG TPA: hypothetical protein VK027_07345 [Chitinophagaceae bacterium]|nr:hypothetical protein [Chitinophagaceae bacterium]
MFQKVSILFLSIFSFKVQANEPKRTFQNKQAIAFTAMGPATWWSIAIENDLQWVDHWNFSSKIGISSHQFKDFHNKWNPNLQLPIKLSVRYGKNHQFGIGFGGTTTRVVKFLHNTKLSTWSFNPFISVDYRFYLKKQFYLNTAIYFIYSPNQKIYLWPGLTFAWVF